jgi:hypothetical protein
MKGLLDFAQKWRIWEGFSEEKKKEYLKRGDRRNRENGKVKSLGDKF